MTKQEDFITCTQCGHTDPLTKKFKCSNCGAKNWGHQLPSTSKSGCLWEIVMGVIFLAGILIYNNVKEYRNSHWSQSRIEKKFSKNMVLVYHEFVYELKFDDPNDGSIYFVRTADGGFTEWKKGMQANILTGCGFVTESDGFCITTENLTQPWPDEWGMISLRKEAQIFKSPLFKIKSGGRYKLFTIKLGYYPNGTKVNDPNSFVPCKVFGLSEKGLDALSPLNSIGLFKRITEFNPRYNYQSISKGDKIYIMGYPLEINPTEKLSTVITQSKIDLLTYFATGGGDYYYPINSLYTLEGAPIFDRRGAVVGFNTINEKGNVKAIWKELLRK